MKAMHFTGPEPYYTNSFMLITDQNHAVVIDPAADLSLYRKALKDNNATLEWILLTHGHFDHVYTLTALKQATGAKVIGGAEDVKGDRNFPVTQVDEALTDGQTLTLDELTIQCWHTPGHTPGSYCFLCEGMLFSGDTLFAGSIGRTDLSGGSYPVMVESLKRLLSLPIPGNAQVLPGHGGDSTFDFEKRTNCFLQF